MPLSMNIDMGYTFVNIVNTITILFMVMGDVAGRGWVGRGWVDRGWVDRGAGRFYA